MRVLVAYATRHGATAGIAERVGERVGVLDEVDGEVASVGEERPGRERERRLGAHLEPRRLGPGRADRRTETSTQRAHLLGVCRGQPQHGLTQLRNWSSRPLPPKLKRDTRL